MKQKSDETKAIVRMYKALQTIPPAQRDAALNWLFARHAVDVQFGHLSNNGYVPQHRKDAATHADDSVPALPSAGLADDANGRNPAH